VVSFGQKAKNHKEYKGLTIINSVPSQIYIFVMKIQQNLLNFEF
jgi:hypothetical protein